MKLLEYENQVFLDLFHDDGLVILAKGLGIERLLMSLIKVYSDPGNLVLIIGTTPQEEEHFMQEVTNYEITDLPKLITNEIASKERHDVYMQGGVLFVTSRILVVDMLMERVPFDLVTGIIVYKAHRILESCQEAFILRLYRQKNKTGFVKALSGSPWAFTQGFCQVQRIMRNLFVKKLYLWPRFHAVVKSSLEKYKPNVIEVHITLTPSMQKIQMALLDIMAVIVKDIKRINPTIDTDEVTVENVISKAFDKVIKYQLDPVWHQLGTKTKRLISDLKTLRIILNYLTQYDCVTFYNLIKSIRDNIKINTQVSEWLFLDAAETVFLHSKERVFGGENEPKKQKNNEPKTKRKEWDIEVNPKWVALVEILAELEKDIETKESILIIIDDDRTSSQLIELLEVGSKTLLNKLYNRTAREAGIPLLPVKRKDDPPQKQKISTSPKKSGKLSRKRTAQSSLSVEETEMEKDETSQDSDTEVKESSSDDNKKLKISYYAMKGIYRPFGLKEELEKLKPKFVMMYDADMGVVREIEIYQVFHTETQLKVYFLVYGGSTEEQRYLTTLRREKEAFEFLIREKSSMVVPENRDGKNDDHPDLVRETSKANETVSSRKAGGSKDNATIQQLVIVDIREFRSELPSLIHRRGIDIEPVTIEVGDYILTPETCVERKSLNDLIGSLNNGRLYNQAQAMCRYYQRPILLIEFDQNKSFSLQGKYFSSSNDTNSTNLMSKLILLTIHFSRLRFLWCPSPYATAEMFELLKTNRDQPTAAQASSITAQATLGELPADKYNPEAQSVLSKLPGINSKNIYSVMNKISNLMELMTLNEEKLTDILESAANAKVLHDALHKPITKAAPANKAGVSGARGGFASWRGKRYRK